VRKKANVAGIDRSALVAAPKTIVPADSLVLREPPGIRSRSRNPHKSFIGNVLRMFCEVLTG
jgi:hypothetical protein